MISVIAGRLAEYDTGSLTDLVNPLMGTIVFPYLGATTSKKELQQPVLAGKHHPPSVNGIHAHPDPFKDLPIRVTFRTARVLATIADQPGASNRQIGQAAGIADQGQMSKLLGRLRRHDLIINQGAGKAKGEANAWTLTERGTAVQRAINVRGNTASRT